MYRVTQSFSRRASHREQRLTPFLFLFVIPISSIIFELPGRVKFAVGGFLESIPEAAKGCWFGGLFRLFLFGSSHVRYRSTGNSRTLVGHNRFFLFPVLKQCSFRHGPDIGRNEVETKPRRNSEEHGPHDEHHPAHHFLLLSLFFIRRRGHRQLLMGKHQPCRDTGQQIEVGPTQPGNSKGKFVQCIGRSQVLEPEERFHP